MKYGFILLVLMMTLNTKAQPVVKVDVSSDTLVIGETVEVTYTIENGDGNFLMPAIDHLPVISGPNSSSSFIYQDGKMSSSQSYSFTLMAVKEGKLIIPETVYRSGKEEMTIKPVEIFVLSEKKKPATSKKNQEVTKPTTTREKKKV